MCAKFVGTRPFNGVPKIFIFDCCRGSKVSLKKSWKNGLLKGISQVDGGVPGKRSYGSGVSVNTLPRTADVLIAWATSDHHVFLSYGRLVLRIPLLSSKLTPRLLWPPPG